MGRSAGFSAGIPASVSWIPDALSRSSGHRGGGGTPHHRGPTGLRPFGTGSRTDSGRLCPGPRTPPGSSMAGPDPGGGVVVGWSLRGRLRRAPRRASERHRPAGDSRPRSPAALVDPCGRSDNRSARGGRTPGGRARLGRSLRQHRPGPACSEPRPCDHVGRGVPPRDPRPGSRSGGRVKTLGICHFPGSMPSDSLLWQGRPRGRPKPRLVVGQGTTQCRAHRSPGKRPFGRVRCLG